MAVFSFERRVEFCETDAAGIAHFSSLIVYMEQAEHALLRSIGHSVFSQDSNSLTWPRVHVKVDFLGPARFEDKLAIDVTIVKLGRSSVRYAFHGRLNATPVFSGEMVSVCCKRGDGSHHDPMRKVLIPDVLRDALSKYCE